MHQGASYNYLNQILLAAFDVHLMAVMIVCQLGLLHSELFQLIPITTICFINTQAGSENVYLFCLDGKFALLLTLGTLHHMRLYSFWTKN